MANISHSLKINNQIQVNFEGVIIDLEFTLSSSITNIEMYSSVHYHLPLDILI